MSGRELRVVDLMATGPDNTDPLRRDLDTLGSLAAAVLGDEAAQYLPVITTPDRAFGVTLGHVLRPFVIALDDPRRVALQMMQLFGHDIRSAIRLVGTSCACLTGTIGIAGGIKVTPSSSSREIAVKLAPLWGFDPSDDRALERITAVIDRRRKPLDESGNEDDIRAILRQALAPQDALAIEAALTGYHSSLLAGSTGPVIATQQTFFSVDPLGVPLTGNIDATGRARCLAYGPYFSIPVGAWTLRMILAFSPDLTDVPFTVDIIRSHRRTQVEAGRVTFSAVTGRYVAQIAFSHPEPDALLEFRLFLDRPVFDGRVSLGYAELTRAEPIPLSDLETTIEWQGS